MLTCTAPARAARIKPAAITPVVFHVTHPPVGGFLFTSRTPDRYSVAAW